jgi:hypothetical protein
VAWVFFRADSLSSAGRMLSAMAGWSVESSTLPVLSLPPASQWEAILRQYLGGDGLPEPWREGLGNLAAQAWLFIGAFIALFCPNSQEILRQAPWGLSRWSDGRIRGIRIRPVHPATAVLLGLLFSWAVARSWFAPTPPVFIYFNF